MIKWCLRVCFPPPSGFETGLKWYSNSLWVNWKGRTFPLSLCMKYTLATSGTAVVPAKEKNYFSFRSFGSGLKLIVIKEASNSFTRQNDSGCLFYQGPLEALSILEVHGSKREDSALIRIPTISLHSKLPVWASFYHQARELRVHHAKQTDKM